MPPNIVLGRITGTAATPKLAPAPRHRKVLGTGTKLAVKNISDSITDELTLRSPASGSHCITRSRIITWVRPPRPLRDGPGLHPRPSAVPAECSPRPRDPPDNNSM